MDVARYRREVKGRLAKSPTVQTAWKSPAVQAAWRKVGGRWGSARRPGLIFVLGSQRSGTNVLRRSLSLDPFVHGFNERESSEFYAKWKLRPEPEIRAHLARFEHTVLLKPIKSVIDRPVADFLAEFDDYDLKVAWIYRDPVAVFRSRAERWSYKSKAGGFIKEWNRANKSMLDANDPRIGIVCYDQLTADPMVFRALCDWLGVRGENLFHSGRSPEEAESSLSATDVAEIREATGEQLERLHEAAAKFFAGNRPVGSSLSSEADTY